MGSWDLRLSTSQHEPHGPNLGTLRARPRREFGTILGAFVTGVHPPGALVLVLVIPGERPRIVTPAAVPVPGPARGELTRSTVGRVCKSDVEFTIAKGISEYLLAHLCRQTAEEEGRGLVGRGSFVDGIIEWCNGRDRDMEIYWASATPLPGRGEAWILRHGDGYAMASEFGVLEGLLPVIRGSKWKRRRGEARGPVCNLSAGNLLA